MLNYANNKNAFIRKKSNGRFGFKVASEILRHDQHTTIPGGRIREIRFFGLLTLPQCTGNLFGVFKIVNFAISNAIQLSTHFWIRKDRIVNKEVNESSAVRSACWLLYKIATEESKIVIREYFYVASSCKLR